MSYSLSMTSDQHSELKELLITECGSERVVWVLCGLAKSGTRTRFLVRSFHALPQDAYVESSRTHVTWKTESIIELLSNAEKLGLSLVKFHSHPLGSDEFSALDDRSDREMYCVISDWIGKKVDFASCIMTPNGKITGGKVNCSGFAPFTHVMIVGPDITLFERWESSVPTFAERNLQAFGEETFRVLRNMRIGIAGCSGTGSQVVEQLVRLGVGELVLVDFDRVEERNLNRITNLSLDDARKEKLKVLALKDRIDLLGLGTKTTAIPQQIQSHEAVKELSTCDVIFGCLDTKGGRHILNRLTSYYTQPYIDVGVRLDADGKNGISGINTTIHYVQPGKASLLQRGIYDMEDIRAENKFFEDPEGYAEEFSQGYVKGVNVNRPAVIPVNAVAGGLSVLELLARIHDFRHVENSEVDKVLISITGEIISYDAVDCSEPGTFEKFVGKGDVEPLLDMPSIAEVKYEHEY